MAIIIEKIEEFWQLDWEKMSLIGENWIAYLIKSIVFDKFQVMLDIFEDDENGDIKEFAIYTHAKYIRCSDSKKRYIIHELLKNELNDYLMLANPYLYEKDILCRRKKELDEEKNDVFQKKIKEMEEMDVFPLFESIEIETINRCNGSCSFCPINRHLDTRPFKRMEEKLFYSIIDQLAELNYTGRVSLFSNNEPFMDSRIIQFAEYTARQLPMACKIIYTNGTIISEEQFKIIIQYLDILVIDIYFDENEKDGINDHLLQIFLLCLESEEYKKKVMVQFISRKAIRNNRGGKSSNRKEKYYVSATCLLPFIQMIVRPDGKTSLCCNDTFGEFTLADLNDEKIIEAWNNTNYCSTRNRIKLSRQNVVKCIECDNFASTNTVGNSFIQDKELNHIWEKIEKIVGGVK